MAIILVVQKQTNGEAVKLLRYSGMSPGICDHILQGMFSQRDTHIIIEGNREAMASSTGVETTSTRNDGSSAQGTAMAEFIGLGGGDGPQKRYRGAMAPSVA